MRLFLRPSGPGRQLPKATPRTMLWVDPFRQPGARATSMQPSANPALACSALVGPPHFFGPEIGTLTRSRTLPSSNI